MRDTSDRSRWALPAFSVFLATLLIAARVPSLPAQVADGKASPDQLPAVERLGEETSSYVWRMGWETLRERLAGTTALAAIDDPQVQAFFAEFWRLTQRKGKAAQAYELALTALHEDLVLAGTERDPLADASDTAKAREQEELEEKGVRSLEIGLVMPAEKRRERFGQLAQAVAKAWRDETQAAPPGAGAFIALGENSGPPLFHWTEQTCYWANSPQAAQWALRDKPDKPLGQSKFFRTAVGPLFKDRAGPPIALYYYDLRPNWARYQEMSEASGWNLMSWRSLDAVAGATFVEDGGFRNRHYWTIGDARTGLFQYSREARLNWDWLKRVPADASGVTTGVFDAVSFVGSVGCLGAWMFSADANTIAQIPGYLVTIQPMLASVGHRYLVYRVPGQYGSFPITSFLPNHNLIAVVEVQDVSAFRSMLDNLTGMGGGFVQINSSKFAGRDVVELNLMYFTVYAALLDREVLIAAHPQLLKDALENWQKPGPALVDTAAFQDAKKYLLDNACFLMYFPPGGFARGIYDEYIPQLQQMLGLVRGASTMFGVDGQRRLTDRQLTFSGLTFPRGRDLARHVKKGTILSARDDGTGVLFDGYAPLLSTPYYWAYIHALTRLGGGRGMVSPAMAAYWLLAPPGVLGEKPTTAPTPRVEVREREIRMRAPE